MTPEGGAGNQPGDNGKSADGNQPGDNGKSAGGNQPETSILLFDTTHAAMEAEDAVVEAGFWSDVVPRPPDAMTGLCGLALEVLSPDLAEIRELIKSRGVTFEVYRPEVEAH